MVKVLFGRPCHVPPCLINEEGGSMAVFGYSGTYHQLGVSRTNQFIKPTSEPCASNFDESNKTFDRVI